MCVPNNCSLHFPVYLKLRTSIDSLLLDCFLLILTSLLSTLPMWGTIFIIYCEYRPQKVTPNSRPMKSKNITFYSHTHTHTELIRVYVLCVCVCVCVCMRSRKYTYFAVKTRNLSSLSHRTTLKNVCPLTEHTKPLQAFLETFVN